jgi:DNA-binding CsgD family transcriptional regulator
MFSEMGVEAFAERARQELKAAGSKTVEQADQRPADLTEREAHIARLAASGNTNAQIGAELYLSRHTVEWHLRKVFLKLGIASRREISGVLSQSGAPSA